MFSSVLNGHPNLAEVEPGQLWVHREYELAFRELGLTTTASLMQAGLSGTLGRRRDFRVRRGWDNFQLTLPTTSHLTPRPFLFGKRHRTHWHWNDPAFREAAAAVRCHAGSVPCMKVVACGSTPYPVSDSEGRRFSSIFLSEPIGIGKSAIIAIHEAAARGAEGRTELMAILDAFARTTALMHASHVYHGDCHPGNFIFANEHSGGRRIEVIDLQSSQIGGSPWSVRAWLRDMCLIRSWWIRLGVYFEYEDHWYSRYLHWAQAKHLQRWMARGGRSLISVLSDSGILRRGLSRFPRLQFEKGLEILCQRYGQPRVDACGRPRMWDMPSDLSENVGFVG
jgi:hypothetical protein